MRFISGIFVTCCLFLTLVCYAQQDYQVSGYVLDAETGEPVPFASVGIPEQNRGISANINGYFRLLVPENNPDHHLHISSIGYQRLIIPLAEVEWDQERRFQLKPETRVLEEITIVGKSQSLEEMVKSTSKNRKIYMRSTPYLMNGYYREILNIDGHTGGFTEGQGILYMNGYDRRYKNNTRHLTYDLIQWKHLRRSDYPRPDYLEVAVLLKAKDYYLHDGPLHQRNLNRFNYTVTDSTSYQDRLVMEISFKPKEQYARQLPYHGKFYVKEDDQALLRLEIEAVGQEPFLRTDTEEQDISGGFQVSFILFEGQYYLGQCGYHREYTHQGKKFDWQLQLVGASFSDQQAMFLNPHQRTVLYSEMLNPEVNYDPNFWDNFSLAQQDDLDPDLKSQFQQHHQQRLIPLPEGFLNYEQMANDRGALDFIMQR